MKRFRLLLIGHIAVTFFYFIFPKMAEAAVDQENDVTLLQFLVGAIVLGWYAWKHFKESIKRLSKNLFSKHKEEEEVED